MIGGGGGGEGLGGRGGGGEGLEAVMLAVFGRHCHTNADSRLQV